MVQTQLPPDLTRKLEALKRDVIIWQEELNPDRRAREAAAQNVIAWVRAFFQGGGLFSLQDVRLDEGTPKVISVGLKKSGLVGMQDVPLITFRAEEQSVEFQLAQDGGLNWTKLEMRYDPVTKEYVDGLNLAIDHAVGVMRTYAEGRYQTAKDAKK